MDSSDILIFLHIAAVVVALGATFSYPFMQAFGEKKGVAATRVVLQAGERLENVLVIPGAILVFVFGLGLTFDSHLTYKDKMPAWLTIGIAWYLVAFAVAVLVQRRQVKKAIAALEGVPDGPELPAAYKAIGPRIQMVGGLLGLSIVGIAFLMVMGANGVW